jgi:hypothetical protein
MVSMREYTYIKTYPLRLAAPGLVPGLRIAVLFQAYDEH